MSLETLNKNLEQSIGVLESSSNVPRQEMSISYLNAILETGIAILEHKLQNPRTGRMVNPRYLRKLTHNLRVHRYTYNPAPPVIQPLPMVGAISEGEQGD